jgi:predicted membrane-bound mannosyltransferase
MAIQEPKPAIPYSKLTVEIGLYAILATLALALRLYRLGLAPLSTSEAMLSVAALRGMAIPTGASPLLYWVNAFLFSTFGAGDTLVRLLPALAGSVLVLLPALMRERIGRVGALGAAALLAISPVAIFTSRTASGDALVAAVMLDWSLWPVATCMTGDLDGSMPVRRCWALALSVGARSIPHCCY